MINGTGIRLDDSLSVGILKECSSVVILLCTLGLDFDLYAAREAAADMTKYLITDAFGSAAVEAGCNLACEEISRQVSPLYTTDRFSPGYSGIPLSLQEKINTVLDGEKRLGVHTNDSFMFSPQKTVSAFVGLSEKQQGSAIRGCGCCVLKDSCEYRKDGGSCAKINQ